MNSTLRIFCFSVALFAFTGAAHAQLWSGVLDPSRATDWMRAGVTGGIPNRTNICTTIAAYTGSSATINTAIQNCSAAGGGVVLLGAGTFTLSDSILLADTGTNAAQNVTLRGSGPTSTTLQFTGSSCTPGGLVCFANGITPPDICFYGAGSDNPNSANWTANYTAGTTQITLDSLGNNAADARARST